MSSIRTATISALAMMLIAAAPAPTTPPTDDRVQEVIENFLAHRDELFASGSAKLEDVNVLYRDALGDLAPGELSIEQIAMLYRESMLRDADIRAAVIERVETSIDDPSTTGAVARILRLALVGGVFDPDNRPDPALQEELLGAMFNHDELSAAIRSGEAGFVIEAIYDLSKKSVWRTYTEEIYGLADDFLACPNHRIAFGFENYFGILGYINEEDAPEDAEARRQAIRADLVIYARDVMARADKGEVEIAERQLEYFEGSIARIDSLHAQGKFIGTAAPALEFIWSSDESLTDLEALKGQVVILDFWATWCGPCVASIPNVRELQARYAGYPVKIIGVTSIQGNHFADDGPVDCKDDPDKEMALMAEYIGQKDITWTIAFTKQEVYNTDYAVRGIPHVAVLAPDGTVRHNDLHPADPLADKAAKIDALLAEFDLPAPAPIETDE